MEQCHSLTLGNIILAYYGEAKRKGYNFNSQIFHLLNTIFLPEKLKTSKAQLCAFYLIT